MGRVNLTTSAARTRIKEFLNESYRELQTALGLGRVRRGVIEIDSIDGTAEYSTIDTGTTSLKIIKPITVIWNPTPVILTERTLPQLRLLDADLSEEATPQHFAVVAFGATSCTIRLWPKPDVTTVGAIVIDGLLIGTEMSADADVPAFPEDYHDALIYKALAEELDKQEKPKLALKQEAKFDRRVRELRYFIAKSAYLHRQQGSHTLWWWGPWGGGLGWRGP